jgi:hypothetical protein
LGEAASRLRFQRLHRGRRGRHFRRWRRRRCSGRRSGCKS